MIGKPTRIVLALLLMPAVAAGQEPDEELSLFEVLSLSKKSIELMEEGQRLYDAGKLPEAAAVFREAADVFHKMSEGKVNSPRIMSHIIRGNAASMLGELEGALPEFREALGCARRVYPNRDHNELALCLESVAGALVEMGWPSEALPYAEEAFEIRRRMAPDPDHTSLVDAHQTMGELLLAMGEYEKALPHFERVVLMNQRLAKGKDDAVYAESRANLAVLLEHLGQTEKALSQLEEALAMHRRVAAGADSVSVATDLLNIGHLLGKGGRTDEALKRTAESVAMLERLHADRDNPHLAMALSNLASKLDATGKTEEALAYMDRAAAMAERLYAGGDHPLRMQYLNNQGTLLAETGRDRDSLPYYEDSLAMFLRLSESLAAGASEVGVLEFASSSRARDDYLIVTGRLPGTDARAYARVWATKAALTRILQRRAEAARAAVADDSRVRAKWAELQAARRELSRLLLAPASGVENRDDRLRELTDRKERLQRELAAMLPGLGGPRVADGGPPALAERLPEGSVFVDLIRYRDTTGDDPVAKYCAFVLSPGGLPARAELGPADVIDRAVTAWRRAIDAGTDSDHAATLRRLVWEPLVQRIPEGTRTVYLAPDGDLGRVPFAALPGSEPGTVLLEGYAFAHVMHGPFLLAKLSDPPARPENAGKLLAVGGVHYGKAEGRFTYLKGTERERSQVLAVAGDKPKDTLTGPAATTAALTESLPKARYAHLATHGFFAEELLAREKQRLAERLRDWRPQPGGTTGRVGLGVRNPLSYVGLVMAGGDVLSGEGIVGLNLTGLELAVLSACETGLGRRTEGEGIYGLQRAFHLAGCDNVMASLWKVDDEATAALMAKFYHELWVNKRPPIEALRLAQLTVLRHPERVGTLATGRGFEFTKAAKLPARGGRGGDRTPPTYWAGFILSGTGR